MNILGKRCDMMESKDADQDACEVAKINGELADALVELELAECVIETGRQSEKDYVGDAMLGYVKIGGPPEQQKADESALFTISHHACQKWTVFREVPGLHRVLLGHFETPYGAVGRVRRYHSATTPIDGATPTYPNWVIEEFSSPLASLLEERELTEYVVDIDFDEQRVALAATNRKTEIHLLSDRGSKWNVELVEEYAREPLKGRVSLSDAIDCAIRMLPDA